MKVLLPKLALVAFASLGALTAHAEDATSTYEMIRVPGGCYEMGDAYHEKHEQPVHKVCLDSFELGKLEVTQAQWRAIMGSNPSRFTGCGENCPVERISWNQVQEFIQRLNAKAKGAYRLPTEAEWEYACRSGGKDETWSGGVQPDQLNEVAWYNKEAVGRMTHPVGTRKPNGLGLHDMSGNVWEWVQDKFVSPYPTAVVNNPVIESGGEDKRVIRGGSWDGKVNYVRCGIRNRYNVDAIDSEGRIGLRLARSIAQ